MKRYSRILILLPPIDSIIEEVKNKLIKVGLEGEYLPEYISESGIEGFAISWPIWYGHDIIQETRAARLRSYFKYDFSERFDLEIIDWIDSNNWNYINKDNYSEVFSNKYWVGEDSISIYRRYLRFNVSGEISEYTYSEFTPDFIDLSKLVSTMAPAIKKLCIRGIFNRDDIKYRGYLYKKLSL